jgi:predicted DNA-binding transcriptional regulator AlpA
MLLTFDELCTFLKADESVVLSLIETGGIPLPVNIGNRLVRWVESDLIRWVQTGCPRFPPPTLEELTLIRTECLEENRHSLADINAKLAADQVAHDK